jgi:hypothetical protein
VAIHLVLAHRDPTEREARALIGTVRAIEISEVLPNSLTGVLADAGVSA